jgi:hypothetical protein
MSGNRGFVEVVDFSISPSKKPPEEISGGWKLTRWV